MPLKSILLAATFTVFAVSSTTSFAVEEHTNDAKTETSKTGKAKVKNPLKKHNHMEEKTGMPMPEPASGVETQPPVKMMDRHDHMKDKH